MEDLIGFLKEIRKMHKNAECIIKEKSFQIEHKKELEDLDLVIKFFEGEPTDTDKLEESIKTLERIKQINELASNTLILGNEDMNSTFKEMVDLLDFFIEEIRLQIQEQSDE